MDKNLLDKTTEKKMKWYETLVMIGLILLLFFLVHGKRVERNLPLMQWEDEYFIEHNDKHMHNLLDCFTGRPLWNGLYRPLPPACIITWEVNCSIIKSKSIIQ